MWGHVAEVTLPITDDQLSIRRPIGPMDLYRFVACSMKHDVACNMLHVACRMWYVACSMSQICRIPITSQAETKGNKRIENGWDRKRIRNG